MIYAKVDVKLRDHDRANRAAEAMSTWLWGLLYTREQELDGFVPESALRGAWVGEKMAKRHAEKLCSVGLWQPADGGWKVARYADKNETKQEVADRRAFERDRKQKARASRLSSSDCPTGTPTGTSTGRPGSGSGSEISRSRARPWLAVVPPPPAPYHGANAEAEATRERWARESDAATPEERTAAAQAAMDKLRSL